MGATFEANIADPAVGRRFESPVKDAEPPVALRPSAEPCWFEPTRLLVPDSAPPFEVPPCALERL